MSDFLRPCVLFLAVGVVLLFSPLSSAQMERSRIDPRLYTQPKPAEKSPAVAVVERSRIDPNLYTQPKAADRRPDVGVVERRRFDPSVAVKPLPVEPCDVLTRNELEAILKRSDTDRALVSMPDGSGWWPDRKKASCSYGVNYERKILPEEAWDNAVNILFDFDDQYAKQGKLIVDRPVVQGYTMALEIVSGLGDEAVFLTDVSRARLEERYKGTAGAQPGPFYRNNDFLLVRHKTIVLKFAIARTVAGNTGSGNHIQIARRVLARLNQASGA